MKKIEEKILNKIYLFETRRTVLLIFVKVFAVIGCLLVLWVLGLASFESYVEQNTIDLFMAFQEDVQLAFSHISDIATSIYAESPKFLLILIVFAGALAFMISEKLFKERRKLRNKISKLASFWFKKKSK